MARQTRKRVTVSPTRRAGRIFLKEYTDRQGVRRLAQHYTIEYYVPKPEGGWRRVREVTDTCDKDRARDLLQIRQGEVAMGILPAARSKTTFQMMSALVEEHYAQNGLKWHPRPRLIEHFFGWVADKITDTAISDYRRKRIKVAQPATVNREVQVLFQAFRLAKAAKLVTNTPTFAAKLRENNVRKGFFEWAEFKAFCAALPANCQPLAHLAYRTGWRLKNELLTRKWSHVRFDLKNGGLRLDPGETKNREGRNYPMTTELLAALQTQRDYVSAIEKRTGKTIPWVFVHANGRQMKSIRKAWQNAVKSSGISRIPHDFRRTAVRTLEEAGIDRFAAMKMVGHKTESIYARYAIIDQKVLDRAKGKLQTYETERAAADLAQSLEG